MKQARHQKIFELIELYNIETQDELAVHLRNSGFDVTQATVSRDIKALKLIKSLSDDGSTYKYSVGNQEVKPVAGTMISKMVIDIIPADSLIIVKTVKGAALAVTEMIKSMRHTEILGEIAGYDTAFLATVSRQEAQRVAALLKETFKQVD